MPINNGNISNNGSGGGGGDNQFIYRGTYNAATNTPTLTNGVGTQGDWYLVTVAGSNNPTGELLAVNQVIAYNGAIWQAGGQIDNTDEIQVSNNYVIIRGQTIQVGQSLTVALGELEGQIADLATSIATALNTKQDLVTGATLNNVASLTATGQTKDSGIASADITTQGNTFNQANKLIQADSNNALPIMSGNALTGLTKAQVGLSNVQNVDQTNADNITSGTLNNSRLNANVTKLGNDVNGNSQLMFTTSDGYIPSLYAGNTQVVNPTTVSPTALNQALENIFMSIPANPMLNPMTTAGDLIIGGTPVGDVAPPVRLPKGSANQVLTIDALTGSVVWKDASSGSYQYTQEYYVDNANGNDTTGDGSYGNPWKTIAHSLAVIPENSTLFVMSSNVDETTVILTANANINIMAFGNRRVNIPQFVVNSTVAGSVSFAGINIGGLAIQPTTICDVYLNNCILTDNINKRGSGYLECNFVDASTDSTSIRSGTFSAFGGKFLGLTVNLTGDTPPIATFNNCKLNGVINVQDGANLTLINNLITGPDEEAIIYSDTGFGTVVNMIGNELRTASGALAAVSVDTYTLYNQVFDKENSTFGASSSDTSWFDKLGITTTETVTTATKMLVRNANGSIAEQLIPSGGSYQYSKIRYVDPVGGNDITGNGAYGNPWKTVAHAVTAVSSGMIICLMGSTSEIAFSISKTNIDIISIGTRSALNGFQNLVTVTGTGAGSIRFQDLYFNSGLTRQAASTCGLYVYNGSIGSSGGFNQYGNGYTELNDVDASNSLHGISSGTFNVYGGKLTFPTITGNTASVTLDNVDYIVGNGTSTTAAMINILESNWVAAATGFALQVTDINAITTIQGCNIIRPNGTLVPVSLTNYDIQNTDFDKANSVLGTHLGNVDWFSLLGLLNADTITGATKMLVRKPTGEIAEQIIPIVPIQFNTVAGSLYAVDMATTEIDVKNIAGSIQSKQQVKLATSNAMITIDQLFSAKLAVGKTVTYTGRMSFYNAVAITSSNYYVTVQLVGSVSGTGQWVNMGGYTQVNLTKGLYDYNPIDFAGTYTNTGGSDIASMGLRITIQYPQANATALVDTLFIQGSIS